MLRCQVVFLLVRYHKTVTAISDQQDNSTKECWTRYRTEASVQFTDSSFTSNFTVCLKLRLPILLSLLKKKKKLNAKCCLAYGTDLAFPSIFHMHRQCLWCHFCHNITHLQACQCNVMFVTSSHFNGMLAMESAKLLFCVHRVEEAKLHAN